MTLEVQEMPTNDNREALSGLFQRLRGEFGEASAQLIIKSIIEEWGGRRLTVPSLKMIYREERNELIRKRFNGVNHKELMILFDLSEQHIRRILSGGDNEPVM